jgi:hypothetical protein
MNIKTFEPFSFMRDLNMFTHRINGRGLSFMLVTLFPIVTTSTDIEEDVPVLEFGVFDSSGDIILTLSFSLDYIGTWVRVGTLDRAMDVYFTNVTNITVIARDAIRSVEHQLTLMGYNE